MTPPLADWRRLLPWLRQAHHTRPTSTPPPEFTGQVMAAISQAPRPLASPAPLAILERTVWQAAAASCTLALGLLVATSGSLLSGAPEFAWLLLTEPAMWLGFLPLGL